jgi:hypothetical protein
MPIRNSWRKDGRKQTIFYPAATRSKPNRRQKPGLISEAVLQAEVADSPNVAFNRVARRKEQLHNREGEGNLLQGALEILLEPAEVEGEPQRHKTETSGFTLCNTSEKKIYCRHAFLSFPRRDVKRMPTACPTKISAQQQKRVRFTCLLRNHFPGSNQKIEACHRSDGSENC